MFGLYFIEVISTLIRCSIISTTKFIISKFGTYFRCVLCQSKQFKEVSWVEVSWVEFSWVEVSVCGSFRVWKFPGWNYPGWKIPWVEVSGVEVSVLNFPGWKYPSTFCIISVTKSNSYKFFTLNCSFDIIKHISTIFKHVRAVQTCLNQNISCFIVIHPC